MGMKASCSKFLGTVVVTLNSCSAQEQIKRVLDKVLIDMVLNLFLKRAKSHEALVVSVAVDALMKR